MHQKELEELEHRLDNEKSRQEMALRDKLALRKQKRLDEHRRRKELELQKEMREMDKEMKDVKSRQVNETRFLLHQLQVFSSGKRSRKSSYDNRHSREQRRGSRHRH